MRSVGAELSFAFMSAKAAVEGRVTVSSTNAPSHWAMARGFAQALAQEIRGSKEKSGEWKNMLAQMNQLVTESLKAVDKSGKWSPATYKSMAVSFDVARAYVARDMAAWMKTLADQLFCVTGTECVMKELQSGKASAKLPKAGIRAAFAAAKTPEAVHAATIDLTISITKALLAKLTELTVKYVYGATKSATNRAGLHHWTCDKLNEDDAKKYFHALKVDAGIKALMDPAMVTALGKATSVNVPGKLLCFLSESNPYSRYSDSIEASPVDPDGNPLLSLYMPGVDGLEETCDFIHQATTSTVDEKATSMFCTVDQLKWEGSTVGKSAPGECKVKTPLAVANLFPKTVLATSATEDVVENKKVMTPSNLRDKLAVYALDTLQQTMRESYAPADVSVFMKGATTKTAYDFTWRSLNGADEQVIPAANAPAGGQNPALRRTGAKETLGSYVARASWPAQETTRPASVKACPTDYNQLPDMEAYPPAITVAANGQACGWLFADLDLNDVPGSVNKRSARQEQLMAERGEQFDLGYEMSLGLKFRAGFTLFGNDGSSSNFCSADDTSSLQVETRIKRVRDDMKVNRGMGVAMSGAAVHRWQIRLLGNPTVNLFPIRVDVEYITNPSEWVFGALYRRECPPYVR